MSAVRGWFSGMIGNRKRPDVPSSEDSAEAEYRRRAAERRRAAKRLEVLLSRLLDDTNHEG